MAVWYVARGGVEHGGNVLVFKLIFPRLDVIRLYLEGGFVRYKLTLR